MQSTSLNRSNHPLSDPLKQLELLSDLSIPDFSEMLANSGKQPLRADATEILQINLGKMCNQTCRHCHVDAGPDRKEIMSKQMMELIIDKLQESTVHTIDLTGGAPELNPNFRWLVYELKKMGKHILVRCNLTIITSNPKFLDLPEFYKENGIEIIASLPYYTIERTDAQRGKGVFTKSISALKLLNEQGYGREDNLSLHLVYNPSGAFLPGDQDSLEIEFKKRLLNDHGIVFNNLLTITNLPISRFLDYLLQSGTLETYMTKLVNAFNPMTAAGLMCRNTLSVGWDGSLYDCDFNQMLDLKIGGKKASIENLDWENLKDRDIITNKHCYGCTAGSGSSCSGAII